MEPSWSAKSVLWCCAMVYLRPWERKLGTVQGLGIYVFLAAFAARILFTYQYQAENVVLFSPVNMLWYIPSVGLIAMVIVETWTKKRSKGESMHGIIPLPVTVAQSEALQPTPSIGNVRVLSYNVWCLPHYLTSTKPRVRIQKICRCLVEEDLADIICFQELFDTRCKELARVILETKYPYIVTNAGKNRLTQMGSGLFIASKYPLKNAFFLRYGDHIGSDWLADKGGICVTVQLHDTLTVGVCNTHGQASPDPHIPWHPWVVGSNLEERIACIRRGNNARFAALARRCATRSKWKGVLACGDWNIAAEDEITGAITLEFTSLTKAMEISTNTSCPTIDTFRAIYPNAKEHPGFTYDDLKNKLTEDKERKRLDYIFAASMAINTSVCVEDAQLLGPPDSKLCDLSDHFAVCSTVRFESK